MGTGTVRRRFWTNVGGFFDDYGLTVSLIAVPLLMSLSGVLLSDEAASVLDIEGKRKTGLQIAAFVALCTLTVLHIILAFFHVAAEKQHTKLVADLESERATRELVVSNAKALCDGYLQELSRGQLGFGTQPENNERVTLYIHDNASGFQPIGRFSFNQSFIKKGRPFYPELEGCIGKAWENDRDFRTLSPASEDFGKWVEECHALGVPKGTSRAMNMKSALYYACTVRSGPVSPAVAVIVVESTDPDRYDETTLDRVLSDDRRAYIAKMVEMLSPWLGDPEHAKHEGY